VFLQNIGYIFNRGNYMHSQISKAAIKDIDIILRKLITRLRESTGDKLQRIILFGSCSRGEHTQESDIDVMVIVTDESIKEYDEKALAIAVDLSIEYGKVICIFVVSSNKYLEEKQYNPFIKNIENEGITIYAA
jgi:predicted nucleotidyltransferase